MAPIRAWHTGECFEKLMALQGRAKRISSALAQEAHSLVGAEESKACPERQKKLEE